MKLDNVFKKTRIAVGRKNYITFTRRPEVPEGLLRKCNKCGGAIIAEDVKKDHYICPKCGGYFRVHARRRIEMITDEGSFEEWDSDLQGGNPLEYKGYEEKLKKLQEKTGLSEAVVTGKAKIDGREAVIGVCDGRFLMASMGEAVGEKIARAVTVISIANLSGRLVLGILSDKISRIRVITRITVLIPPFQVTPLLTETTAFPCLLR